MINRKSRWRWYHGVLFYAGVQAATFGLNKLVKKACGNNSTTEEFYNRQTQPIFAPPSWAFAPAWTINNALAIWGLLRVLNMPEGARGRDEFLALQAASWADFVLFSGASFGLRSNINSAVLTCLYFALTLASTRIALYELEDAKAALSLSTLTAWLALASWLSIVLLMWNGDEFYGVAPLVEP